MANQTDTPNKQAGMPEGPFRDILLSRNYDSAETQKQPAYGKALLKRIFQEQSNLTNMSVYAGRNIKWLEVWKWATGRQEMQEFQDFTNITGDKAYVNIDWEQNRTGPQFVETLVQSMSIDEEYAKVIAVDDGSRMEKEKRRLNALYRMHDVQTIADIQDRAGMAVEPPNAYVPDDEMVADIHFKMDDQLEKEIEYEEILSKVMVDNEYPTLKRRIKRDGIVLNCMCTKVEKMKNGFIGIRKVMPANLVYNFFTKDSGKLQLSYIGEIYKLKIKDLRSQFGRSDERPDGLTEQQIFNLGKNANQINTQNRFIYNWDSSYAYATERPYDDYGIDVFDCEVQMPDNDYYVSKVDKYGKENIQPKRNKPNPTSDKASVLTTGKLIWRRGIVAIHADEIIHWGLPELTIAPYMDIQESLSSYSIQIPNNDGDYMPSLFERALEPLREYQLCKLKRKQLISELRPAGISINIEAARYIDLGNGNSIPWEENLKMYNQTGKFLWSNKGDNPLERLEKPFEELPNAGSVAQIQELCNIADRCLMEIRSLLGVPMYRDGSDLKPRMGQSVVENQQANANNVTDFINSAYLALMQETLHKVCILKWDEAVIQNNDSRLIDTKFEIAIELKPTQEEKVVLEQMIQVGMQEGLLTFKDAFRIRQIKNYKLASLYLIAMEEKNKKEAQQQQQQLMQMNNQQMAQTELQKAQQEAILQKQKMDAEKEMEEYKNLQAIKLAIVQGSFTIAAKPDAIFPSWLAQITNQLVPNISIPVAMENKQLGQQVAEAAQEEMEQQQPGQAPPQQQGGQPMPQEGPPQ